MIFFRFRANLTFSGGSNNCSLKSSENKVMIENGFITGFEAYFGLLTLLIIPMINNHKPKLCLNAIYYIKTTMGKRRITNKFAQVKRIISTQDQRM